MKTLKKQGKNHKIFVIFFIQISHILAEHYVSKSNEYGTKSGVFQMQTILFAYA